MSEVIILTKKDYFSKTAVYNIGFYKLVWIFAACCVVGFCVETLWCYLRHGYIESRKSLVWGPLSVAYGMGGILLTLVLYHFKDAPTLKIFAIAFVVGTVAEYICSLGQEIVFHSVAWDYSNRFLNINGRVCLLYSLFWGALGVLWAKVVMPLTDLAFTHLPQNASQILALVFTVFFVVDCVVSAAAGLRMGEREKGIAPKNKIEAALDKHFPDEKMHEIYANSKAV